jgi:hypothetical protein
MDDVKASARVSQPAEDRVHDEPERKRYQATKNFTMFDSGEESSGFNIKVGDVVEVVGGKVVLPSGNVIVSVGFDGAVKVGWFVPYESTTIVSALRKAIRSKLC